METIHERYSRLSKETHSKYDLYLRAHRKAAKDKTNTALQKEVAMKKQEWLEAIKTMKKA